MDHGAVLFSKNFFPGHGRMGRPRTTTSLVCPLCERDFSKEKYGTTAYKRHVARANPCVRPEGSNYIKKSPGFLKGITRHNFDDMSLSHVVGPPGEARPEAWIRALLHQVFAPEENRCILLRNIDVPDEIYVKRQGKLIPISSNNLTILTLLMIHERLMPFLKLTGWTNYEPFRDWVEEVAGIYLNDTYWCGTIEPQSYYYMAVRDFLKKYLVNMPHRRRELRVLASAVFNEANP